MALWPAVRASDPWELRQGYLSAQGVELDTRGLDAGLEQRARELAGARFQELGLELSSEPDPGSPRVLLRVDSDFPASFAAPLERLGFSTDPELPGQFSFFGRAFDRDEDGLVATFEDPDRPGLPVTIWYANAEPALLRYMAALEPQSHPGFSAFRSGEVELSGALSSGGTPLTAELVDRRAAWLGHFKSDRRVTLPGLSCRVPERFEAPRAVAYLGVLDRARATTLAWADPEGTAEAEPEAAIGETHVVVHGHIEEMLELLGEAELSLVNPITGTVHVLLAEGLPDDGGAAMAESAARRYLGPPSAAWLGPAAGVLAAGSWWGRDLDDFAARLVRGGVVPPLEELLEPSSGRFISPHVRRPLLGLFLRHLAATHEAGYLRDLWTGAASLDPVAARPGWQAELERLGARELQAGAPELMEVGSWRAGCQLVPGEVGYGSRLLDASLDALVAHGAGAVSLRAQYFREEPEPSYPGRLHRPAVAAREGDLALASAAAAAHRRGLEVELDMALLVNASGGYTAALSLPDVAHCQAFFDDYEPFLVHAALLAELLGAARFSVGTGLTNTTRHTDVPGLDPVKRAGWQQLLTTARGLFDGQVLYIAGSLKEAEQLLFAEALDVLALELYPRLEDPPVPGESSEGQAPNERTISGRMINVLVRAAELAEQRGVGLFVAGTGFASTREAWKRTDLPRGVTSPETQLLLYRTLASSLARLERRAPGCLVGLMLWNWSSYPLAGGLADRGYSPQGKPAEQLLGDLFEAPR